MNLSPIPDHIHDTDVLIIGAGPTGLVLALWLTRLGVRVRILDKTAEPGRTSRALAVQARTLEFYRQLGFADIVVELGRRATAANLWVKGRKRAHIVFGDMGAGITPYPYPLIFPQDEHEQLLIERLAALNVHVERSTGLLDFATANDRILAHIQSPAGTVETCTATFIAGCDGARSTVREKLGIGFAGGTYEHLFYVADVQARGKAITGELQLALDDTDFLVTFPLHSDGGARLIGTIRPASGNPSPSDQKDLTWNDVSNRVLQWIPLDVERVNWFSTYRVHHRVAAHFRGAAENDRAFLLGDAAHIHSPVGGQGMNTGIGDAVNLAWKLAAVLQRRADSSLLDTYEPERIAFARRLVATTDRAFTAVTSSRPLARFIRLRLVPLFAPLFFSLRAARRFMFRMVSQTVIHYRESALSQGRTGSVHGGDRLPWVLLEDGSDNFAPLASLQWQLHIYGKPSAEIRTLCTQRDLALHAFPWEPVMRRAGLSPNAACLIRPDGYIALADRAANPATLASYLDAHHITI